MLSRNRIPGLDGRKKNGLQALRDWAAVANDWSGIGLKIIISLGTLLSLAYLFFSIHFFPSGIGLADTLLFVAIAAGFATLHIFFVLSAALAGVWMFDHPVQEHANGASVGKRIAKAIAGRLFAGTLLFAAIFAVSNVANSVQKHLANNELNWWAVVIAITLLLVISGIAWIFRHPLRNLYVYSKGKLLPILFGDTGLVAISFYIFLFLLAVSLLALLNGVDRWVIVGAWIAGLSAAVPANIAFSLRVQKKDESRAKGLGVFYLISISVLAPLLSFSFIGTLINATFTGYGIRQEKVTLLLSRQNFDRLRALVPPLPRELTDCGLNEPIAVHNANVLWHGMGDRSLVEIPVSAVPTISPAGPNSLTTPRLTVELEKNGLQIARGSTSTHLCVKFVVRGFETGRHSLSDQAKADLNLAADAIRPILTRIKAIEILGSADERPIESGNNYKLSLDRADAVKSALIAKQWKIDTEPLAKGQGVAHEKDCSSVINSKLLDECHSPNRRVEVKLFLSTDEPTGKRGVDGAT